MSKVIAIMSMSIDGYVADRNDGVADVFDWYFTSGDVAFPTGGADPMTFQVSAPSAAHLRTLWSELGAVLTGRRTFDVALRLGRPARLGTRLRPDPRDPGRLAAPQLDGPLRDRRPRQRRAPSQGRRREVRRGPRRGHHPAVADGGTPRRTQRRPRRGAAGRRSAPLRPPRQPPAVLGNPTVIAGVGVTHLRYPVRKE